ncbi:uncharacterized protein A4U43_C07F8350 [Asparagus officinalis]|uniref:Glucosidase 2 subunit beta n=1 Tax=Asparagus officinalis TaxID=4686 RepID=A0A5P1EAC6_ASPOF|nr:glucosidase 2 subunit beta [Asparagus officinalis]ONK62808.1 uncharacterized protein A4U43_C07F8350 [Asparagus officinalis]
MEKKTHLQLTLSISCLCLLWISGLASVSSKYSLGIDPIDESYYQSNVIKCKDGSKKFTREELNDDFCDCPDGTDEPGTSACPEGKFYCKNAGHIPVTIFSSRVNDGICDCCDGSDEYHGLVNCPNTCWEAGKEAREKLNKRIKTYQEGVIIRKKEVEKAKQDIARDKDDLSKLKSEEKILKDLVDKLKEHKERIEKAEEEERLKKEKEEERLKEAERQAKEQEKSDKVQHDLADGVHEALPKQDVPKEDHDPQGEATRDHSVETELSANHFVEQHVEKGHEAQHKSEITEHSTSDGESPSDTANQNLAEDQGNLIEDRGNNGGTGNVEADSTSVKEQEHGGSDDTSGLSKEELGRLVASRWTGENAGGKSEEAGSSTVDDLNQDSTKDDGEDDDNAYTSETDEDRHKYDEDTYEDELDETYEDDHVDDHVESEESYSDDEIREEDDNNDLYNSHYSDSTDSTSSSWLDKIKHTVNNVLSSFNFFRTPVDLSEADRVRKEYADSKSKLSKVQSRISSLTDKLKHDYGMEKEFYSFHGRCFENKQGKYLYKVCPFKQASQVEGHSTTRLGNWEKFDESYRIMQFTSGDKCWNGPDRSLKVRLRCGLKNELTDVDEPSRCEYVALLSTPALCVEDKLKELQQKLEQMNSRQPESHDEL